MTKNDLHAAINATVDAWNSCNGFPDTMQEISNIDSAIRALQSAAAALAASAQVPVAHADLDAVRIWLIKNRPSLTLCTGARVNEYLAVLKIVDDLIAQQAAPA